MIPSVTVRPLTAGWQVETAGHEALVFASGAEAERAARRMGEALAQLEGAAAVRIFLRDGRLGGRFLCTRAAIEGAGNAQWKAPGREGRGPRVLGAGSGG